MTHPSSGSMTLQSMNGNNIFINNVRVMTHPDLAVNLLSVSTLFAQRLRTQFGKYHATVTDRRRNVILWGEVH